VAVKATEEEIAGIKKISNEINELCMDNNIVLYYENGYTIDSKLKKSKLGDDYKEKLSSSAVGIRDLLSSSEWLDEKMTIMGYSQSMIEEFIKANDVRISKLDDNQGIMLLRRTNVDGNGGESILSMEGETYLLTTLQFDADSHAWKTIEIEVVDGVDDLLVYPSYQEDGLCLILDIDQYNNYFNNGYVSSFYLKDIDAEMLDKIQAIIKGNQYIQLTDLEDQQAMLKLGKLKRLLLTIVILGCCCFFSLVNIQVQNIFEYDYRKAELVLLDIIGIPKKKKIFMMALESSYIYLIGYVLGLGLCKIMKVFLYCMCILDSKRLEGEVVFISLGITVVFMLFSVMITYIKYGKEYYR
jgi:hypothetical protein